MNFRNLIFAAACTLSAGVFAEPQRAPEQQNYENWVSLTPAQRAVLIAPLRARWDDNPSQRGEIMARAQHWAALTPAERKLAQRGMHRWEKLSPEQRAQAKQLYMRMKDMPPEARKALRDQWHNLSPEQRTAWLKANPPR